MATLAFSILWNYFIPAPTFWPYPWSFPLPRFLYLWGFACKQRKSAPVTSIVRIVKCYDVGQLTESMGSLENLIREMGTNQGSVSHRGHSEVTHSVTPWLKCQGHCWTLATSSTPPHHFHHGGTLDCTMMVPISPKLLCVLSSELKSLGKIIQSPLFTVAARVLGEKISGRIQHP